MRSQSGAAAVGGPLIVLAAIPSPTWYLSLSPEGTNVRIRENVSLAPYNTLGLDVASRYLIDVESTDEVCEALAFASRGGLTTHILGGGSNVVFSGDYAGVVIRVVRAGVEVAGDIVTVHAGNSWHGFVMAALELGFSGIENLAFIPGWAGAAPVQNIGAYGAELAPMVHEVHVVERQTGKGLSFAAGDCHFKYRGSVFKCCDDFVITALSLRLARNGVCDTSYAGLDGALGGEEPTPLNVARAVGRLRSAKLPDPALVPNVGSFFKNPVVSSDDAARLQSAWPGLPAFAGVAGEFKLSAAWLIDRCGLKGTYVGGARVSSRHALVIENAGGATPNDVLALEEQIAGKVLATFGVELQAEPVHI
jgi:UDP-N-acetylmuramate dehydrogenase